MQIRFDETEGKWFVGPLAFSSEEAARLYLDARQDEIAPAKPHPVPAWAYILGSIIFFTLLFIWVRASVEDRAAPVEATHGRALDLNSVSKQTIDGVGFLINANSKLCAEVLEIRQRDDGKYAVVCREIRAQSQQKKYTVDMKSGAVD